MRVQRALLMNGILGVFSLLSLACNKAPPAAAPVGAPGPGAADPAKAEDKKAAPLPPDTAPPAAAAAPAAAADPAKPEGSALAGASKEELSRVLGTGGGGFGQVGTVQTGSAFARPAAPKGPVSRVVPATAEVQGPLDKDSIQRVIRRFTNHVRFCYDKELTRDPALAGTVTVQFTVDTKGTVSSCALQSSTVKNPAVEQCIVTAVRRWEFPPPDGGKVVVTYPFVLTTGEP